LVLAPAGVVVEDGLNERFGGRARAAEGNEEIGERLQFRDVEFEEEGVSLVAGTCRR